MSKELEYEFNNFANLLNKDCMNLMECLKKQDKDNKPILYLGKHFKKVILPYEEYQKMCNRLEAIDNANPSEALECLNHIKKYYIPEPCSAKTYDCLETIKQALLKAQEPKQYLKWEDLEFKREEQKMKVIINGSKYKLSYFTDGILEYVDLLTNNEKFLIGKYVCDYEKQFFNDLHLERVEE